MGLLLLKRLVIVNYAIFSSQRKKSKVRTEIQLRGNLAGAIYSE